MAGFLFAQLTKVLTWNFCWPCDLYCFPNPSNRTLSDPGPAQVLIEMDAFNRKGLHLNALVLEVKSHSSSSDLNELSLGLHMDVTRCN